MPRVTRAETLAAQEVRNLWLSGIRLEEMLPLCPNEDTKKFITNEIVSLEMKNKQARTRFNAHIISNNRHGCLSS